MAIKKGFIAFYTITKTIRLCPFMCQINSTLKKEYKWHTAQG